VGSAAAGGASPSAVPGAEEASKKPLRPSIPVYIMTSPLTHRHVVEHLEANSYFGLPARDVFIFSQPVSPVLDEQGLLLPQSLGGEFAHAPGGAGQVLRALRESSFLEQMRDRGVDCLHILGTDNLLARVVDPVFLGFCRDLEIDCATKIVKRVDIAEEMEIFAVRQGKVSTNYADVEEAAYGVEWSEAPSKVLEARNSVGDLGFCGAINSHYLSLSFAEEVVGRPTRTHKVMRTIPYLDFYVEALDPDVEELAPHPWPTVVQARALPQKSKSPPSAGVLPGGWPAERPSPDFACQRALLAAGAEVRAHCAAEPGDGQDAWRCDVHLDPDGPRAVVRVRQGLCGTAVLDSSLNGPSGSEVVASERGVRHQLRCSLVVPSRPNAMVLESSVLDFFAYTDRAVALQVDRSREFAPVNCRLGLHTPEAARWELHTLHCNWALHVGAAIEGSSGPGSLIEVSPLVSYDGEGLSSVMAEQGLLEGTIRLPCHVVAEGEAPPMPTQQQPPPAAAPEPRPPGGDSAGGGEYEDQVVNELDTRPFYFQEYPHRPAISRSHTPKFPGAPGAAPMPRGPSSAAEAAEASEAKCCGEPSVQRDGRPATKLMVLEK